MTPKQPENNKRDNPYSEFIEEVEDYAIVLLDPFGIIQNWNKGAEKIKGYKGDEIIGENFRIFYTPEDKKAKLPEKLIEEARIHGKAISDGWRVRKNQTTFLGSITITALYDESGNISGFLKVTRDLSERFAKERFSMVIESTPYAMILVNQKGKITLVNRQLENLFGYSRDEVIDHGIEILIPKRFKQKHPELLRVFFEHPETRPMGSGRELFACRKDGTEFPVEIGLNSIEFKDGNMVLASITDITERKIQEANRLKSEFLATMSHELRTPMNAIIGFSEMLIDKKVGDLLPKQLEYIKDIHSSGSHLLHLINDVLDISKIEAGKIELQMEFFSMYDAIEEVFKVINPLAEKKNIRIECKLSSDVDQICLDKNKFRQILYNLLSNAIKFNKTNGSITIETTSPEGNFFMLIITDTGIGIAPEDLSKLFIPFMQLDSGITRKHEGTGLGLALTKKLIEAQRGEIRVESILSKGSSFIIRLPVNPMEALTTE